MAEVNNDASMTEDFTADSAGNEGFAKEETKEENGAADSAEKNGDAENPIKEDDRKLFIGGLSWESTEKDLREYFSQFGEIESVNVKTDPNTGRSRGFAFLVFTGVEALDKVMNKSGDHVINGKAVDPKKAKARHSKIFVGGLKPEMSDDDIRDHFSTFGTIVEIEMPQDKVKKQRKGFCFITYDQESVVQQLVRSGKTTLAGVELDVKKATPKPDMNRAGGMGAMAGYGTMRGRGGRGGGWGGGGGGWGGYGGYGGYGYGGYDGYGYGGDYYGGYGSYGGGGYDAYGGYGGYGSYGGYGGSDGSYGGKQRGGGRSNSRHQPY